jgi:hypothetical protein
MFAAAVCVGGFASCEDRSLAPSVQSFCGGVCQGAVRCDPRISYQACSAGCVADSADGLAKVRPEAAAAAGACLSTVDCTTFFDDPFDLCWGRARNQVEPSPRLRTFCPPYSASAFECGAWYGVEDCMWGYNLWTDDVLDAAAACTSAASCDAEFACLDQVFGGG